MIVSMLIIWVNILCVSFLLFVYLKISDKVKVTITDKVKRALIIVSAAGVFTKMGHNLVFILIIVAIGWMLMIKERSKNNV